MRNYRLQRKSVLGAYQGILLLLIPLSLCNQVLATSDSPHGAIPLPVASTTTTTSEQNGQYNNNHQNQEQISMFDIQAKHMALSLRLTCEMNRRLQRFRYRTPEIMGPLQPHHIPLATTPPPEQPTVFHSPMARRSINLQAYIRQILDDVLQLPKDQESLVLSLAMIYLDRASSVETLRSQEVPACPFCTTGTVHRLVLASLVSAAQVLRQQTSFHAYLELIESSLDISVEEVEYMMNWMRFALGDAGYFVSEAEMLALQRVWERVFGSSSTKRSHSGNPKGSTNNHNSPSTSLSGGASHPSGSMTVEPGHSMHLQDNASPEMHYGSTSSHHHEGRVHAHAV